MAEEYYPSDCKLCGKIFEEDQEVVVIRFANTTYKPYGNYNDSKNKSLYIKANTRIKYNGYKGKFLVHQTCWENGE